MCSKIKYKIDLFCYPLPVSYLSLFFVHLRDNGIKIFKLNLAKIIYHFWDYFRYFQLIELEKLVGIGVYDKTNVHFNLYVK